MFATAVGRGDYVAVAGGAYDQGLVYISVWWLSLSFSWCLVAYIVFVPMYRAGIFTNAEYLESCFGRVACVISVLIQIQTRTNVMANGAVSLYLTFSIFMGPGPGSSNVINYTYLGPRQAATFRVPWWLGLTGNCD